MYRIMKDFNAILLSYDCQMRLSMSANGALKLFTQTQNHKVIHFSSREEFTLYVEVEGVTQSILSSAMTCECSQTKDAIVLSFSDKRFIVEVRYFIADNMIKKQARVEKGSGLLKRISLEESTVSECLTRGGEGQPIFVGKDMWCGIEFPVALNRYDEGHLNLCQNPFVCLENGFCSFTVAYAFRDCDTLEQTFIRYIEKRKCKKEQSLKIYCDWGLHDELSDGKILDEALTLQTIATLNTIKEQVGLSFDYYLMDAFWFETGHGYMDYKRSTFPRGIANVKEELQRSNMKFGLWFDINFIHAKMKNMPDLLRKANDGSLCLACPQVEEMMTNALLHHMQNDGVSLLKFDFAYFDCEQEGHGHSTLADESKEASVTAFARMMKTLRAVNPELIVLVYNGWTTELDWIGSVAPRNGFAVSPWWSEIVDYVYCGDPRPSEIPSDKLSDSILYYTDAMIENFSNALFPLSAIDDHGCMLGDTATIYQLGKETLKKNWMMNVLRGGKKLHLYGHVGLLSKSDKEFLAFGNAVYEDIILQNMQFSRILGNASRREVYGYSGSTGMNGYIAVMNPKAQSVSIRVNLPEWSQGSEIQVTEIFRNDVSIPLSKRVFGGYDLSLQSHDLVVLKWCQVVPTANQIVMTTLDAHSVLEQTLSGNGVYVRFSIKGKPVRTEHGIPEGICFYCDHVKVDEKFAQSIWSGMSWNCIEFKKGVPVSFCIVNNSQNNFEVRCEIKA